MPVLPHWSASIHKNYEAAYQEPMCMAAIIDAEWLLTSYQCLDQRPATYTRVALARDNLGTLDRLDDLLKVKAIYHHPDAYLGQAANDLSLLQLEQPLAEDTWPTLPEPEAPIQSDTEAETFIYSSNSSDLVQVQTLLLSAGYCKNQLGIDGSACLASTNYPLSARDAGAAFIVKQEDQVTLQGILSNPEHDSGYPVISDISQQTDWIKQVMAGEVAPSSIGGSGSAALLLPMLLVLMALRVKSTAK